MTFRDEYRQWPTLTQEEFELACAYFESRWTKAELGPKRHAFHLRVGRTLTTGKSHIEIICLLKPPDDQDELALALGRLSGTGEPLPSSDMEVDMANEDMDKEALRPQRNVLPDPFVIRHPSDSNEPDSFFPRQSYVTYEIHLHPTYNMPTLWFTLHDLSIENPPFDLDSIYRYVVPEEYKSKLRSVGVMGGISAAPHPITDVPAFFIHPCQTKEAMENFDCPMTEYMMVWIGLVGGCVGLTVPSEMAEIDVFRNYW